jgi:endoglucanase
MEEQSLAFLKQVLETPSPSGYEQPVQEVVRRWVRPFADEVTTDRHGNVIARRKATRGGGEGQVPRVMLAGHCDQIALMVQHIDENGYLYIQPIGGWDMQILLGQGLTVWGRQGPLAGVVSRRAPHLLTPEERAKVPQFTDVWVDVGCKDRKEAESLVQPGDVVTFALGFHPMRNGLAYAPGMDDKVGLWVCMEALRLLAGKQLGAEIFAVSTVQEEIGLRGAITSSYGIHPTHGIAVDVTHATDTPGNDKKTLGEVKVGAGPVLFRGPNVHPRIYDGLREAARKQEIAVQVCGLPRGSGTDANAMQLSREGVATGLIGIPNRYMHSPVEVVSLDDLDRSAKVLAAWCLSLEPGQDWTP